MTSVKIDTLLRPLQTIKNSVTKLPRHFSKMWRGVDENEPSVDELLKVSLVIKSFLQCLPTSKLC